MFVTEKTAQPKPNTFFQTAAFAHRWAHTKVHVRRPRSTRRPSKGGHAAASDDVYPIYANARSWSRYGVEAVAVAGSKSAEQGSSHREAPHTDVFEKADRVIDGDGARCKLENDAVYNICVLKIRIQKGDDSTYLCGVSKQSGVLCPRAM